MPGRGKPLPPGPKAPSVPFPASPPQPPQRRGPDKTRPLRIAGGPGKGATAPSTLPPADTSRTAPLAATTTPRRGRARPPPAAPPQPPPRRGPDRTRLPPPLRGRAGEGATARPPHSRRQTRPEPHPSPQRQRLAAVGHVRPPLLHPSLPRADARTRRASLRIAGRAGEGATARPPHSRRQTRSEPHPSPQRQRLAAVGHVPPPASLPQPPPSRGTDKTRPPPPCGEGGTARPLHSHRQTRPEPRLSCRTENVSPRSGALAPASPPQLPPRQGPDRTRLPSPSRGGGPPPCPAHPGSPGSSRATSRRNDSASPRSGASISSA